MQIKSSLFIVTAIIASLTGCKSPEPTPSTPDSTAPVVTPMPKPVAATPPTPPAMPSPVPAKIAMMTLKFNSTSIDAIQAGTKTSTTRKGIREFPGNTVTAVDGSNADRTLTIKIVSAVPKKMSDLTDADAKSDGSDSLDDLKTAITTNYPGITPDDMVTVITFQLAK